MYKIMLDIKSMEDAKNFVNICRRYDFNVDVLSQQYVVDAKSILGVLSLDLSQPVEAFARSNDCGDLMRELEAFVHQGEHMVYVED